MAYLCLLLLGVVALYAPTIQAAEFQGCYYGVPDLVGVSRTEIRGNTNADCANHCGNRGYILSATRLKMCYCMMSLPQYAAATPENGDVTTGPNGPCNLPCDGSLEQGVCEGDECCGGEDDEDTYSVYTVGGMDVVSQIMRRVKNSIVNGQVQWLTRNSPLHEDCKNEYEERMSYGGGYIKLDLPNNNYTIHSRVNSPEDCQAKCNADNTCRSVTFFVTLRVCAVNKISVDQALTLPSDDPTYIYDRKCTYQVELITDNFDLEMVNFERMLSRGLPSSVQPLLNEDFELDLRHANQWDTVRRNIQVNNAEEFQLTTQSGIDRSNTRSRTEEESTTESETDTTENSNTQGGRKSAGVSLSTTATVGFSGWFVDASVSVTAGINSEVESSFSNTNTRSKSSTKSKTQSTSETQSSTTSNFFHNGYHQTKRTDKSQSYEFSMTVPPLHRGKISFLVEEAKQVLKWKATFRLNGFVNLRIVDFVKQVHVSRLLRNHERLFHFMGTVVYNRRNVIGKIQVWDRFGNLTKTENQLVYE